MKRIFLNGLLLVCTGISLIFTSCKTKGPTEPEIINYHNKILFTSSRSGKDQLYMMNPDGTGIRQITSGNYWNSSGRWSPDATRIVCNTEENTTTAGASMVVMNLDGSNKNILGYGSQMCWSPDNKKIAFIYLPMAESGYRFRFIYTINSNGTSRNQITTDSLEMLSSPSWSVNENKIYFVSNRYDLADYNGGEIYFMNYDGTGITRLTYTKNGHSYSSSISPSGKKIIFMSTMNGAIEGSIYMCDINGDNIILIATPPEGEIYNYPRWSPDEKSVIFIGVSGNESTKISIYKIGIDGINLTKLTDNADVADWSE
jgi:Tol biopolymer transport system component